MWQVTITDRNGKERAKYTFVKEPIWRSRGRAVEGYRTTSVVPDAQEAKKIYIQIGNDESMVVEEL
jgi:hypothetical protein